MVDQYAKAKELLSDVVTACGNPTSGASLVSYDKVFATNNEMNDEIIFAIRYRSGKLGIGSPFTVWNFLPEMFTSVIRSTISSIIPLSVFLSVIRYSYSI